MNRELRVRLAAAHTIRESLSRRRQGFVSAAVTALGPMQELLQEVTRIRRQATLALCKGNQDMAENLLLRCRRQLADMPYHLDQTQRILGRLDQPLAGLGDIFAELEQLTNEFEEVSITADTVEVTTEAIELQGVYLGPFRIELDLYGMGSGRGHCYRVLALDPQPAAGHADTTHPHVIDDRLCEGDASLPVASAISEGRVCDLMLLLRSVLSTYNPSSAYTSLDDWGGICCNDCGLSMAADDTYWCHHCGGDYCSECTTCCDRCDRVACHGCLDSCSSCDAQLCRSCRVYCESCGTILCPACLEEQACPCQKEALTDEPKQAIAGKT